MYELMTMNQKILKKNLDRLLYRIGEVVARCHRNPEDIRLVIVTKDQPVETIIQLKELGYTDFGESHVKELLFKTKKTSELDVRWHFIGRFYPKQVKKIVGHVKCVHSVYDAKCLQEITKRASYLEITQNVLLQVNASGENTKQGFSPHNLLSFCRHFDVLNYPSISVKGLMTIAPNINNQKQIRNCFQTLRKLHSLHLFHHQRRTGC